MAPFRYNQFIVSISFHYGNLAISARRPNESFAGAAFAFTFKRESKTNTKMGAQRTERKPLQLPPPK